MMAGSQGGFKQAAMIGFLSKSVQCVLPVQCNAEINGNVQADVSSRVPSSLLSAAMCSWHSSSPH